MTTHHKFSVALTQTNDCIGQCYVWFTLNINNQYPNSTIRNQQLKNNMKGTEIDRFSLGRRERGLNK